MKLKQYSKKKPCYYCGAPPPSIREHVPPEMMFSGFGCDSITVPSCERHNTEKGTGDRGIITALIMSAYQMLQHRDKLSVHLTDNVIKAVELLQPEFAQAKNEVSLRHLLIDPPEGLNIPLPYTTPGVNIRAWMRQLTAALLWSLFGKHEAALEWEESWAWSPGFMPISEPVTARQAASFLSDTRNIELELEGLTWRSGWSSSPRELPADIYSFDVCFLEHPEDWDGKEIVFRHKFYNRTSTWYVGFAAPQEFKAILIDALDTV